MTIKLYYYKVRTKQTERKTESSNDAKKIIAQHSFFTSHFIYLFSRFSQKILYIDLVFNLDIELRRHQKKWMRFSSLNIKMLTVISG